MPRDTPLDLEKVKNNIVKKVPSMEEVPFESIWAEKGAVITFLRRFGCLFCRQMARELSTLTPLLESHNVKNVAVGVEDYGLEEFLDEKFFDGDLYIDVDKKTFKDIGYKRFIWTGAVLLKMLEKPARDRLVRNRKENLPHNTKGDRLQTGGTIVIAKGGEVILDYRQDNPGDLVDRSEILRVLNIPDPDNDEKAQFIVKKHIH